MQKGNNHRFNLAILKNADTSPTRIEVSRCRVDVQPKIRIVPCTHNRVEMIDRMDFVHRIGENYSLLIRNELIIGSLNNKHRWLILMNISNRAREIGRAHV